MFKTSSPGELLREITRGYIKIQRENVDCCNGISAIQCHILNELLRTERLTQQMLVERLGADKAWISRAVEVLIKSGDLVKNAHETDRRSNWIKLTGQGVKHAGALDKRLNDHANLLLREISEGRQAEIQTLLISVLDALTSPEEKHAKLARQK